MKIKVEYTINITDAERHGIEESITEMADRETIKRFLRQNGTSLLDDMSCWYADCIDAEKAEGK